MKNEKILVTSALPYANGPIHFGHIAGAYLPADVFVRFKKMCGVNVTYLCGTDEHGFAITTSAKQANISPKEHVKYYHEIIKNIFQKFDIKFDYFSGTHKPNHFKISQTFFTKLLKTGKISQQETKQLYCNQCSLFLADRYITGTCPQCNHIEARGDECEKCGAWLEALEIIEPQCKMCHNKPVIKDTTHWFLNLNLFEDELKQWLQKKESTWKSNVLNFIKSNIEQKLKPRPITRDMDWGIPVPVEGVTNKVLYVWFDAPIAYISITQEWLQHINSKENWEDFWKNKETKIVHFIGKDNLPFHCIVWPSILKGQEEGYNLPTDVPANEFYHLEGKSFSKSRGWYIDMEDFFSKYSVDSIRYCIASNAPETKDSSFKWKEFQNKHNSELADTLGNFINRSFKFTEKYANNRIPLAQDLQPIDNELLKTLDQKVKAITEYYNTYQLRKASYEFMDIARIGNKYFDEKAPWKSRKTNLQDCMNTLYISLILVKKIAIVSYPIIPNTAKKIWKMLGNDSAIESINWFQELDKNDPIDKNLNHAEILFSKIEDEQINQEIEKLQKLTQKRHDV